MGIVDNSIPKITYRAGTLNTERPKPFIDDIFDPVFNTEVRKYLYDKYDNNRLLATLGGYAELTENALTGHKNWGILGPGMGIWSAFGRSMDKADDFILGGITEGVKGLTGQGFENPMTNIFEKDQDYTGTRLLSAMANSFNSMSGGKIGGVTTEKDFGGLWKLPGLGIDLATDPGIIGGATARASQLKLAKNLGNQNANKTLKEVGTILNEYDDIMAKVAGNVVVPGMHFTISKLIHHILNIVQQRSSAPWENVRFKNAQESPADTPAATPPSPPEDPISDGLMEKVADLMEVQKTLPPETSAPKPMTKWGAMLNRDEVNAARFNEYLKNVYTWRDAQLDSHAKRLSSAQTSQIRSRSVIPSEHPDAYARNKDVLQKLRQGESDRAAAAVQEFFDFAERAGVTPKFDPMTYRYIDDLSEDELFDVWTNAKKLQENVSSGQLSDYNPEYVPDLFEGIEDQAYYIERLKRRDFQNTSEANRLFRDLGFDPRGRYRVWDNDIVPHFQTSQLIHDPETLKSAVNIAASNVEDLRRVIGPTSTETVSGYLKRALGQDEFASDPIARYWQNLIPDAERRQKVVKAWTDLVLHNPDEYQNVQDYLKSVRNVQELFQNSTNSAIGIPEAVTELIDELLDKGYATDEIVPYFQNILDEQDPLTDQIISYVNRKLGGENLQNFSSAFDTFIARTDEDLFKPLYGTQVSVTNISPEKITFKDTDMSSKGKSVVAVDDFRDGRTGHLGKLDNVSGTNKIITRELSSAYSDLETSEDLVYYINELLRRNPQLMDAPGFWDQMQNLAKHYQFHLGQPMQTPKWLEMLPKELAESLQEDFQKQAFKNLPFEIDFNKLKTEFNNRIVPLVQNVLDKGHSPFIKTPAKKDGPLMELQKALGYFGDVKSRSPYWLEMRTLLNEQVYNNKVYRISTRPRPDIRFSMAFRDTPLPYIKWYREGDTNKWNNPGYVMQVRRQLIENRFNRQLPTLRAYGKDSVLDPSLTNAYATRDSLHEYLTSSVGRELHPDYSKRLEKAQKNAALKASVEGDIIEEAVESAAQTAKTTEEFIHTMYDTETATEQLGKEFRTFMRNNGGPARSAPKQLRNWDLAGHVAEIGRTRTHVASSIPEKYPTVQLEATRNILNRARALTENAKRSGENLTDFVHKYRIHKQAELGSVLRGATFLEDLIAAKGIRVVALPQKDPLLPKAQTYFSNCVAEINKQVGVPFLRLHTSKLINGNIVVGVTLNTDLSATPKELTRLYSNLKKVDTSKFGDFEFVKPGTVKFPEIRKSPLYEEIDRLFTDLHTVEKNFNRWLGFDYTDAVHVKNVYKVDERAAQQFKNAIYAGIDLNKVADFSEQLGTQDRFFDTLHGAFYTTRVDKRILGNVDNFEFGSNHIFTDDLVEAVQGALTGGAYDNMKFQTFIGYFTDGQFNIHEFVKSPDDLKQILMPGGSKEFANLHNLVLASPKYDDAGRVIGFKRYSNLTDLDAAFKDPHTVLLTESAFAPLDSILKRQKRFSNKAFRWMNQHVTVPYKFGVLMNPGFLLGNMNDAYLKQATAMAQKYGTSLAEECGNVYKSMADVIRLNNAFSDAYDKFVNACDLTEVALAPTERNAFLIMKNKHARRLLKHVVDQDKGFENLITAANLTTDDVGAIRMWMFLNNMQNSAAFSRNLRDAEDIAAAMNTSPYAAPTNIFDRILKGQGQYDPRNINTWGLFLNNPGAVWMMDTSEDIEKLFRSAAVLNDLRHQGTPLEDLADEFARLTKDNTDPETMKRIYMGMQEAVDAMANSNFDYESSSDFMDAAAKIMPFPTFYLKNLAFWLQLFVDNPQYIDNAIDVQNSLWQDRDTEEDEFQAEAKGRGAIPVEVPGDGKLSKFFKGIYKPTPLNSMFGALNAVNEPFGDALFRLHPAISTAAVAASRLPKVKEAVTPYMTESRVQYRPYSTNPYEKNVKYADPKFNPLKYTAHRFNPMERTLNTALRTPKKVKAGTAQLSDFLPSIFQPDFSKKSKK